MNRVITLQAFVNRERYRVPKEVLDSLPGGVYTPYVVAQEGESTPYSLEQRGNAVLRWSKNLIQSIAQKFAGIKFFRGHGKGTNSHAGRETVGRAVKVYTDTIDGKESVVALLKGQYQEDICSMEAQVRANSAGDVEAVENISAVALGDSRVETPAFRGATALQQIQCFKEIKTMKRDSNIVTIQCFEAADDGGSGGAFSQGQMSYHQLRQELMSKHVYPREVYSVEQILDDRELFPKISERILKDAVPKDEYNKLKADHEKTVEELTKYRDSERLEKAVSVVDKAISERKYSAKQKEHFKVWKEEGFFDDIDPANEMSVKEALEKAEQRYKNWRDRGLIEDKDANITEEDEDNQMSDDLNDIVDELDI